MVSLSDYENRVPIAWCPGCGNFAILNALKQALVELKKQPHQILLVSGIGQAPKLPHYLRCNAFVGLHGRSLPVATAAKTVNHKLTVIVIGGDGDCYSEGGNHLIHTIRRNPDITLLVHNNQVYGLTRGQASPTCEMGFITKVQTHGVLLPPLNPLTLAISQDASFVGRGYAGKGDHLKELIKEAVLHPGFALIDILQPCVSFDHRHSYSWYQERVYIVGSKYDSANKPAAFQKAQEWEDKIPLGIIYKKERPAFEHQQPVLKKGTLISQAVDPHKLNAVLSEFI
ncbi:MAG: thiamine pyrophosphate-dependent enzyme [Thermodesulfobacteriota bacterium]